VRATLALVTCVVLTVCKQPETACSLDLQTDSFNCGACGRVCAAGSRCETGVCVTTCAGPRCGEACVDLQTDPRHCGRCGAGCNVSHATPACVSGQCTVGPCEPGWSDCDGSPINGCERQLPACIIDVCAGELATWVSCHALGVTADGGQVLVQARDPVSFVADLYLVDVLGGSRLLTRPDASVSMSLPPGAISGDGRYVVFARDAPLTPDAGQDLFVLELETGTLTRGPAVELGLAYQSFNISHDGRRAALGDSVVDLPAGPARTIFSHTRRTTLSADGRFLGGLSAPSLTVSEAWIHDLDTGRTRSVLPRPFSTFPDRGESDPPVFSFDGRIAAFHTTLRGFIPDDTDAGHRIAVANDDGAIVLLRKGFAPSLSYDSRRLAYLSADGNCEVLDVASGNVVWRVDSPRLRNFTPQLSGDGRVLMLGSFWIALPD
jgi:hypothetical protein